MVVNAPPHPARNVNIENDRVPVGNDYTDPLVVGGEYLGGLDQTLHKILEQLELHTEILKEIGK